MTDPMINAARMIDPMKTARRIYAESLHAMDAELTALLAFAKDFKGEESSLRLQRAQALIREELES
jgi:hypothetical protein